MFCMENELQLCDEIKLKEVNSVLNKREHANL